MAQRWEFMTEDSPLPTRTLLYADDTLLAERHTDILEEHLHTLVSVGAKYGLELHWGKTFQLSVRDDFRAVGERSHQGMIGPWAAPLPRVDKAVYLGGLLTADGLTHHELSVRIGEAASSFESMRRVWRHANIPRWRKQEIFDALIESKSLHALETCWLKKSERKRLEVFYIKCLRKVHNIQPAYVSHTSNEWVLRTAKRQLLGRKLLQRQLLLFGHIARQPNGPLRDCIFQPGSNKLVVASAKRPRGRPRQQWAVQVYGHAMATAGNVTELNRFFLPGKSSESAWRSVVATYCSSWSEGVGSSHSESGAA